MPIEIMPETISVNMEQPVERMSGEEEADVNVFVQVSNTEPKSVKVIDEDITIAFKSNSGKIIVAQQPRSINGSWDGIDLKAETKKILNLEFLFSAKIIKKLSDGVGSVTLEIKSHAVEIAADDDMLS